MRNHAPRAFERNIFKMILVASFLLACGLQHTVGQEDGLAEQKTKAPRKPVAAKTGTNLVKNGGFEKGDPSKGPEGWQAPDGLCSFWIKDPQRGGQVMKFDTNVPVKEFRARRAEMKLEKPPPPKAKTQVGHDQRYSTVAAHDGVAFYSDPIPVEQNRKYRLRFDCRVENEGKKIMSPKVFVVGYFDLKGEERRGYKVYKSAKAGAKWQTFTLEFTPASRSSQVTRMRVMLFPYWPPGVYYFDDVQVEALTVEKKTSLEKGATEKSKEIEWEEPDAYAAETSHGPFIRPDDKWWNKSWPYRRQIIVKTDRRAPNEAYVSFPTNGRCQPDGRDIVVIAGDALELPSKVIACGWDDSAMVAFELRKSETRYHVYFGNRRARKTVRNWEPEGGLLLEVRAMGEGTADTLDEMFDLINRSPQVLGRDFRTRPALTVNPFGPQEKYISTFHGILRVPESGEYTFAVNSRDASFALVNGNLVASWPGKHDADGWAAENHSGKLYLNKGKHRLSFFNAAFGQGGCVLGISAPTRPGVRPLLGGFLIPIQEGTPMGLETLIRKPEPDFILRFEDDLSLEGFDASKWSFRNTTPYLKGNVRSCSWDFGDGQTGTGTEVEHLYLEGGRFAVTMTLELGEGQVLKAAREFRLQPRGLLDRQGKDRSRQYLEDLVACIEHYDLSVMSPAACSTLATIAKYTNRPALELEALSALYRQDPSLEDPGRAAEALEFGKRLASEDSNFEESTRILSRPVSYTHLTLPTN